jgi:acyl dehydratase
MGSVLNVRDNFGGFYEDFQSGQLIRHWPGKTIFESDNNLFCLLTRNDNPIHTDEEYMSGHQHGKILVVGTLVISLIVGMTVRETSGKAIANLEYEKITHDGPVFIGDTLYAETEILNAQETSKGNRGIIHVETRGINQRGEKILTVRRRFLVPKEGVA